MGGGRLGNLACINVVDEHVSEHLYAVPGVEPQGLGLQVVDEHVSEHLNAVHGGLRDSLQVVNEHISEHL